MDVNTLKTTTQKVIAQRNIFLLLALLSSVAIILLSTLLLTKKERIIVLPIQGPAMWVEDDKVSTTYIDRMGLYLSDLLLNRTPSDVEKKNKLILEHVHPSFYQEIKKRLELEKEQILRADQSIFFRSNKSSAEVNRQRFAIEGELLIFVGKSGEKPTCAQQQPIKFVLEFVVQRGKLLLTALKKEEIFHE